jgi:hypothetical protein
MRRIVVTAASSLLCAGVCLSSASPATAQPGDPSCEPTSAPILLDASATDRLYVYSAPLDSTTFSEVQVDTPMYEAFLSYLQEVNATADVNVFDQRALLERQRDVFIRFLGPEAGEFHQRVLDGEVGQLGKVTCLQSVLFDLQNADWPLSDGPVEMGALVLQRQVGAGTELRAYVKTQEQNDFLGLSMAELMPLVEADVVDGWQLLAHMHSHPLVPDGTFDIAGTVLPSSPDSQHYRDLRDQLGMLEAWITNGTDSARYVAAEFDELE